MSVTPCCSMRLVLYGPFCQGALKLYLSTLFTTFISLNISSIYITIALLNISASILFQNRYNVLTCGFNNIQDVIIVNVIALL